MFEIATRFTVEGISPLQITEWCWNLDDEKYRNWHPDHKSFRWMEKTESYVGSRCRFEETPGGVMRDHYTWQVARADIGEPFSELEFKAKHYHVYPVSITLSMKKNGSDTEFTHTLRTGVSLLGSEVILDGLVRILFLSGRRVEAFRQHVIEEYTNLPGML